MIPTFIANHVKSIWGKSLHIDLIYAKFIIWFWRICSEKDNETVLGLTRMTPMITTLQMKLSIVVSEYTMSIWRKIVTWTYLHQKLQIAMVYCLFGMIRAFTVRNAILPASRKEHIRSTVRSSTWWERPRKTQELQPLISKIPDIIATPVRSHATMRQATKITCLSYIVSTVDKLQL